MWRLMAAIRPTLLNFTNSHRVADENMFTSTTTTAVNNVVHHRPATAAHRTFSQLIFSIIRAPFSILSCFAPPPVHGAADAFWLSASTISETNHLMVSDGMRYAILM